MPLLRNFIDNLASRLLDENHECVRVYPFYFKFDDAETITKVPIKPSPEFNLTLKNSKPIENREDLCEYLLIIKSPSTATGREESKTRVQALISRSLVCSPKPLIKKLASDAGNTPGFDAKYCA